MLQLNKFTIRKLSILKVAWNTDGTFLHMDYKDLSYDIYAKFLKSWQHKDMHTHTYICSCWQGESFYNPYIPDVLKELTSKNLVEDS